MSDLIKIMLIEDDPTVCEGFELAARHRPGMAIVYETGSEQEALAYLQQHKVDVIILDIELEEGDGISFLDEMVQQNREKPFVVVVTNNCSVITLGYMQEHGADYVYQKHNCLYSPERVLCVLEKICPYQKAVREHKRSLVTVGKHEDDDDIRRQYVEGELHKMGFKKTLDGFTYIVDAVMILMDYSGVPPHVTSEIYPMIAKARNVSVDSVERSIRHSIEAAFRGIDRAQLNYYYPYPYDKEKGRPSNRDFLVRFAQRIRL